MPFQVLRNDITKVKTDAIVNTANPEPVIGAGTDYAIHQAAGPELLEARKKIGNIRLGQSVETPAFGLHAKYVLHTVSPAWVDGNQREEEYLRQAYDSALYLADRLGCESIAFPLMAAGTYAFPHEKALAIAIQAFTDFLMDHEMRIDLVLFNGKAFGIAGSIFDNVKSYIDDNYVKEQYEKEYGLPSFRRRRRQENIPSQYTEGGTGAGLPLSEDFAKESALPEDDELTIDSTNWDLGPGLENEPEDFLSYSISAPSAPLPMTSVHGNLEDLLRQSEKTFSEYLLDLLKERDGKDSEVYKRAEVSKQLFSKILNNKDYQPTKNTVLQLAIGLQLDLEQTKKLLDKAGYSLTRSSKADLVVQYYIEHEVYSVTFINEALYDCGLPLLKTGLKT